MAPAESTDTRLGRIEGKLDLLMARCPACQEGLDNRIKSLERWRAFILGGAAVVTLLLNIIL
jgi:hypothetical protein